MGSERKSDGSALEALATMLFVFLMISGGALLFLAWFGGW